MWFRLSLLAVLLAPATSAQTPRVAPGLTVSGVVYDSLARSPLAGATVQLVGSADRAAFARTVVTDEHGSYVMGDIPPGRFMLGFFHPLLDSLGVALPPREVNVQSADVRADLAVPSSTVLRAAICASAREGGPGAVMVGFVRDGRDGALVAGGTVSAEWVELTVTRTGFTRRTPRVVTTTQVNGWFALCDVPAPGTISVVASRGGDSTAAIELHVPAGGLLRRELYIGGSRDGDRRDADGGRLSGTVVSAIESRPVAGARVSIPGGPETTANDGGEWTLIAAPLGTRMLEVRALGFYPEQVAVDVVRAGGAPVRTTLSTMKAVLDTVRITASRLNDPHQSGFAERRQAGMGRYLTQEHVKRYQPLVTSDLLRFVSGVYVERNSLGDASVSMRGMFTRRCAPAIYLDGHYMRGLGAEDINSWVSPDEIAGIEVYSAAMVPPQFSPGMNGCGSIVIWTQPSVHGPDPRSLKRRFFTLLGGVALGLIVGATLK